MSEYQKEGGMRIQNLFIRLAYKDNRGKDKIYMSKVPNDNLRINEEKDIRGLFKDMAEIVTVEIEGELETKREEGYEKS